MSVLPDFYLYGFTNLMLWVAVAIQWVNLTRSSLNLHSHLHPLQAANLCHNSRLVGDEDDLKWLEN